MSARSIHFHTIAALVIAMVAGIAWGAGNERVVVIFAMYALIDHTLTYHRNEA